MLEYSESALQEAAAGFRRIEKFLARAVEILGEVETGSWLPSFEEALDDDLSVPQSLAVIHDAVREGNKVLESGDRERLTEIAGAVRAMAGVLGVDPMSATWSGPSAQGRGLGIGTEASDGATSALDVLVRAELDRRAAARTEKDFATADEVRDRLKEAGVVVTDTPEGATWSLG